MTLRDRLADWISGGIYSQAIDLARKACDEMVAKHNLAVERYDALCAIADMETPSANATVKRMAKAARDALE